MKNHAKGELKKASAELEALVWRVTGAGMAVHRALGPGLLESVFRVSSGASGLACPKGPSDGRRHLRSARSAGWGPQSVKASRLQPSLGRLPVQSAENRQRAGALLAHFVGRRLVAHRNRLVGFVRRREEGVDDVALEGIEPLERAGAELELRPCQDPRRVLHVVVT